MRKITFSLLAAVALSSVGFAGGDIQPVEPVVETPPVVEEVAPDVKFYVGAGYSYLEWDHYNGDTWEGTANGGTFLAGVEFNEYVSIEGRYTVSFGDYSWDENGATWGDESDDFTNLAIYLKPTLPLGEVSLYGLIGYGKTTMEFNGVPKHSDTGLQWGIGASMAFNENISAFVDYTVMFDDDLFDDTYADTKVDAINVGVTYTF